MNIPIDEVIFFDCITTHPTTGAATDADSTPTFAVYEESTDTDIGIGGNLTKRTSLTGNYRGTFTLSAANGFEAGKWYSIIGSATVNAIAGKAVLRNFRCVLAEATAGIPKADVDTIKGNPVVNGGTITFPSGATLASTTNITAGTLTTVTTATNLTTYTGNTPQTGDAFARIGVAGVGLTNVVLPSGGLALVTAWTANITGTITTVTNLTNLTAAPTDWLTAAAVKADAVTKIQLGLSTYAGGDTAGTTTILSRVTAAVALASTALTNVTWTDAKAAFLDGSILSRMATYTQPTGFLAATFPGTVASTTNITGGVITTVTTLTNLPAITANWLTAAGLATDAVTEIQAGLSTYAGGDTAGTTTLLSRVTAAVAPASTALSNATWTDAKAAFLDAAVTSRMATFVYTAPDNANIVLIKVKTDLIPAAPAAVGDIPTAVQNADALLKRDWTVVTGEASRSLLNMGRFIRNGFSISGTTLTVVKEDDTTAAYTRMLTTTPGAAPVTGVA